MPVRIVTDSAADLTEAEAAEYGISVVPLSIRFGDEEFTDRVDLSVEQFYEKMDTLEVIPETAAPSPGAFDAAFRQLVDEGATGIVCVTLSQALSATGQSAANAARELADLVPVACVDSRSITGGQGTLAIAAARRAAEGASVDEVVATVEALRDRIRVYGILDTLENLKKGGRIGGAQALLGTMLSIKPCLDLSSGEVVEAGKQRTRKKALAWLRSVLAEAGDVEELTVIHGLAPDVEEFLTSIADLVPRERIRVSELGAVIGSHGGPRVIGITYLAAAG